MVSTMGMKLSVGTGSGKMGVAGKIFASLFLMFFLSLGLMFTGLLVRDVWKDAKTYFWPAVQCEILESKVVREATGDQDYVWKVRYTYEVGGIWREGKVYRQKYAGSTDCGEAERLARRYPPEAKAICYVDKAKPADAVLDREELWVALFGFIPLFFVAVGAGGIYFTWRPGRPKPEADAKSQPMSAGAAGKLKNSGLGCLFIMFLLFGGGMVIGMVVVPAVRILGARSWPAVQCTIVSSEVRSHSGDGGPTYSVDILYRYKINGKEYQSNRYKFMGGSSSWYKGKQQIVNQHKRGTKMVCYVDPSDPTQAVLERGFTADLLLGLIPLVFVGIGGGGLMYMRREKPDKVMAGKVASRKWLPKVKGRPVEVSGATKGTVPVVLKPAGGPGTKLLITIAMAAFWNGIVSVFVVKMVGGWARGKPDMCLTVFLIPFEVIGVVMLGAVVYCGLAFFNPRLTMVVSRTSVRLGDTLTVAWQIGGRHERIVRLRLWLIGREEATYQRGTSTTTDKSVFAKIPIVDASKAEEIRQGKAIAQIPRDTMHSFDATNNKIVWVIAAEGEIPRWPDIGQEYRIVVLPAGASEETRP